MPVSCFRAAKERGTFLLVGVEFGQAGKPIYDGGLHGDAACGVGVIRVQVQVQRVGAGGFDRGEDAFGQLLRVRLFGGEEQHWVRCQFGGLCGDGRQRESDRCGKLRVCDGEGQGELRPCVEAYGDDLLCVDVISGEVGGVEQQGDLRFGVFECGCWGGSGSVAGVEDVPAGSAQGLREIFILHDAAEVVEQKRGGVGLVSRGQQKRGGEGGAFCCQNERSVLGRVAEVGVGVHQEGGVDLPRGGGRESEKKEKKQAHGEKYFI